MTKIAIAELSRRAYVLFTCKIVTTAETIERNKGAGEGGASNRFPFYMPYMYILEAILPQISYIDCTESPKPPLLVVAIKLLRQIKSADVS